MASDWPSLRDWINIFRHGDWYVGWHPSCWFAAGVTWYDGWHVGVTFFKLNVSVSY